jgi:hypothetical protein
MIAALIQVITGIDESRALSRGDPKASSVQRLTRARAAPLIQKIGCRLMSEKLDEHRDHEALGGRKAGE